MKNEPITLYADAQFASPYAMPAYVALREKNLPFELLTLDLDTAENCSQWRSRYCRKATRTSSAVGASPTRILR